jgi:type II secretory pathway component GspD/PulD (secretin)
MIALLIGASCTEIDQRATSEIDATEQRLQQRQQSLNSSERIRAGGTQLSSRSFVAPQAETVRASKRLPPQLAARRDISLVSRNPLSLGEIVGRLNEITGVPHLLALGPSGVDVVTSSRSDDGTTGATFQISGAAGTSRAATARIRPNLSGSLGDVLDQVSSAFEVEWEYIDGRIVIRDYVTRQYQVSLLPVTSTFGGSAGGVTRGGSIDLWQEIEGGLTGLTGEGSRISIGRGTGIVTMTGLLRDHQRVRQYIAELNDSLGQQIAFDVNVITVVLNQEDSLGVGLSAAFSNQNVSVELLSGPATLVQGAVGSANIGIVSGDLSIEALIDSLSRRGRVAVETRAGATTTNFQPVPIAVTEEIAYVASTEQLTNTDGNPTGTSQTVETIEVGFELQLYPRVLNTREVMINFGVSISDLNAIRDFGDVQLPETSRTSLAQQVILRNDETLVLAGFERRRASTNRGGGVSVTNLRAGGGRSAALDRVSSVIVITPRILSRQSMR